MPDVVAIRIESQFLKILDELGKEESADRSTIIRQLIKKGYKEVVKEKAAKDYIEEKITISEAAHNAKITIFEMERYLIEKGFKSDYSIEDIEREMDLLSKIKI